MTIFNSYSTLTGLQDYSGEDLSLNTYLRSVIPLRKKLESQSYILDAYLSIFFEISSNVMAYKAADDSLAAISLLYQICKNAVDQEAPDPEEILFYQKASQLLKTLPPLQERDTKIGLLILALADEFLTYSLTQYMDHAEENLHPHLDFYKLPFLFDRLSKPVDNISMEQLNHDLKKHFLIAPISAVFIQSFHDKLLHRLITIDIESSRQYFSWYWIPCRKIHNCSSCIIIYTKKSNQF